MSGTSKNSPFSQFSRVAGRHNSLAPFYIMSNVQQVVTGDNNIEIGCYKTRLYSTDETVTMHLGNGFQDGQMKRLKLQFKGNENANVIVECPSLPDMHSRIVFTQVGDYAVLQWTGGSWIVIDTDNEYDPNSQPTVE